MKKILVILVILVLALTGIFVYAGLSKNQGDSGITRDEVYVLPTDIENSIGSSNEPPSSPKTYSIDIEDFAYSIEELRIKMGDTVVWTNQDNVMHTVTSDSGNELDSEFLSKGESYTSTFNTRGTYDYYCSPHPYITGTIVVE